MTGARVLVTGGAGFIGSHVCDHLLETGDQVTVLDNFVTGQRQNLAHLDGRLRLIEGSITDPNDVARAAEGVDGIVHLAALPSVTRSLEVPLEVHEACATGTIHILNEARHTGVRVVYAGSSSAYGDQEAVVKNETLRENPLSPYAAGKLAGELYCRAFARVYDLPVVVTRFFNVYGPRQVPDSPYSGVVAAFCLALLEGRRPRIDGDGTQSRDFTYVGDVARGIGLALRTATSGCELINLARGGSHTVAELLETLQRHAGTALEAEHGPPRRGDVRHSRADVTRARELLAFESQVSFSDGLQETLDWYRNTRS